MWEKELSGSVGRYPWKEDLPLSHRLPNQIRLDLSRLRSPLHPMFALRLRIFRDWHAKHGREVVPVLPEDAATRQDIQAIGIFNDSQRGSKGDVVMPVSHFSGASHAEDVVAELREHLEYERADIAETGAAASIAAGELLDNALDHGRNDLGAYLLALRSDEPRPSLGIAIADLGEGIPEHIRRQYPEWSDDCSAIARALENSISGTGDRHRGFGFGHVFDEVLRATFSAAEIEIYSANGYIRTKFFDGRRVHEPSPPPHFRRGTSVVCRFVTAVPPD